MSPVVEAIDVDKDRAALATVWSKYRTTSEAADLEGWLNLWTEDGVQMPDGVPQRIGKAELRKTAKEMFDNFSVRMKDIDVQEVQVAGEWAYSRGTYHASFIPKHGGEPMNVDGKFITILKRQPDGTWKIHRDCFNSNAPA